MTGGNRRKYGVADDASDEDQVRGFARFTHDLRREMATSLGRDPTWSETYLGHYWGGSRGAHAAGGRYTNMAPQDLFSPLELRGNPNLLKHGTVHAAATSIMGDMDRRQAKFGGSGSNVIDFASFGQPQEPIDFSAFGQAPQTMAAAAPATPPAAMSPPPGAELNVAQFGMQ